MTASAVVTGWGSAFPPGRSQEEYWDGYYGPGVDGSRWMRQVFLSAGCLRRHTVFDPTVEDLSTWSTARRMERYLDAALPLAASAAVGALRSAGVGAGELGLMCVASCTGYATPGLDVRLAEVLSAGPGLRRLLLGHMGCHAALPGLGAAADYVAARRRPALLVCAEVCSLHAQPPSTDLEQVVAHALFSDGAAAVVVAPAGAGLEVVELAAATDTSAAGHLRWEVTDLGFRMGLSRRLPDVLACQVGPLVDRLLAERGLCRGDVAGWAVHPGGPRVLDVVADRLGLDAGRLDASWRVLREHGNCSSPTILMVLDEVRAELAGGGGWVVGLAFGPGLTLYGTLLRADGRP
ncbi:MAG: type III polyketide synthase [Acidimicrobiales bacterium]